MCGHVCARMYACMHCEQAISIHVSAIRLASLQRFVRESERECVCVCVCACVRACVYMSVRQRATHRASVRACVAGSYVLYQNQRRLASPAANNKLITNDF